MKSKASKRRNLLSFRLISRLLKSSWFPITAQILTLGVFALLVAGGIGAITDEADIANELRNTNLANLLVWCYWWPIIIIAAILFGRLWCMVCPMELVAYLACRIGL